MNASCCRPDLDVKARSDLTVSVTLFPLALHRPVGEDLEVMSAIHAVQPSQSPVVPQLQRAAVPQAQIHHRVSIRHPARQETSLSTAGGSATRGDRFPAEILTGFVPLQRSGVYVAVNERETTQAATCAVPIPGSIQLG